jgi:hypothetical protein
MIGCYSLSVFLLGLPYCKPAMQVCQLIGIRFFRQSVGKRLLTIAGDSNSTHNQGIAPELCVFDSEGCSNTFETSNLQRMREVD